MKKIIIILYFILLHFFLSCSWIENGTEKVENNKVELEVDIDGIAKLNNATDSELYNNHSYKRGWGTGLNSYSFRGIEFDFEEGYRYRYIEVPNQYSYPAFFSYFVLRKRNNCFYLIDYKVETGEKDNKRVYSYKYRCYKYYVSSSFLKFEESDEIFEDVLNYVNSKNKK